MTDGPGRPLLFLDVDGPLLPFGGSPLPGSREIVAVPHLARLRLDAGPRLAGLPCTLVWATTWLEDANTEIAPRLGLPDLPVVIWPEPLPPDLCDALALIKQPKRVRTKLIKVRTQRPRPVICS